MYTGGTLRDHFEFQLVAAAASIFWHLSYHFVAAIIDAGAVVGEMIKSSLGFTYAQLCSLETVALQQALTSFRDTRKTHD